MSHGPPSPVEGVGSAGIPSDATVTVLIPAYNEEARIAATVRAAAGIPRVACVMVVDDGSQDNTSEAAREAGAHRVVTMPRNRGKGAALNAGCVGLQSEILLLLDADLGETAAEGSRLLQPVLSGEADMTIATLPPSGSGGGFGLTVNLARWGIRRLGGSEMSAPLSGQRCLTRAVLEACGGFEAGFGVETALTIDALSAGFRIVEVETAMAHRVTGRSPGAILHRSRQFRDIGLVILRRLARRPRIRKAGA